MNDQTTVTIAGLWAKTSAAGRTYLVGRINRFARVIVRENTRRQSDAEPSHLLQIIGDERPRSETTAQPAPPRTTETPTRTRSRREPPARDPAAPPPFDDEIGF